MAAEESVSANVGIIGGGSTGVENHGAIKYGIVAGEKQMAKKKYQLGMAAKIRHHGGGAQQNNVRRRQLAKTMASSLAHRRGKAARNRQRNKTALSRTGGVNVCSLRKLIWRKRSAASKLKTLKNIWQQRQPASKHAAEANMAGGSGVKSAEGVEAYQRKKISNGENKISIAQPAKMAAI